MPHNTGQIRKRIAFDHATWNALDRLGKDRMVDLQDLADEAFRDLLKKHRRPITLKEMLRESIEPTRQTITSRQTKAGMAKVDIATSYWVEPFAPGITMTFLRGVIIIMLSSPSVV